MIRFTRPPPSRKRIRRQMRPVLFNVLGFSLPSYGFMLALSFLIGIGLAAVLARRDELDSHAILDVGIWIVIGALVGARLYYVLLHFEDFHGDFLSIINPFQAEGRGVGGLVAYGGMMGGTLAAFMYLRMRSYSFPQYMDTLAPGIALGVVLTRVGCFLNGCCYGTEWKGPLAVSFPSDSPAGEFQAEVHAASLHPSELYESFGGLVLLAIVLLTYRGGKRRHGSRFYLVLGLYAVLRFLVDLTRHYEAIEKLGGLSHSQIVSMALLATLGLIASRRILSHSSKSPGGETPL